MFARPRITGKAAASLVFGLGSFILMADLTQIMIIRGDRGGNVFQLGFPSLLGWVGIMLWIAGIFLMINIRIKKARSRKGRPSPVFLKGRNRFRCRSCKTVIMVSEIDYSGRVQCQCGAVYDVYQDPERT